MKYEIKNYVHLQNIGEISNGAMSMHFKLYEGYVNNLNILVEKLEKLEKNSPEWNELHRRFGWEYNGMLLHELFFDGLTPALSEGEGEAQKFFVNLKDDFIAIAKMRGMGWAMLVQDNKTGKLINTWVNEHDAGMMADVKVILCVDMFEHSYIKDFGTDRASYLESIFAHIDWEVVSTRLTK